MPRLVNAKPKYRKHRASGQAVVTIAGKDHYLGPHGSKASKREYDRLIAEWEAGNRSPLAPASPESITVVELCAVYWRFAQRWYVKDGRPTEEQDGIRAAIRPLKALYGHTAAVEFGPKSLRAVRQRMVESGQCRSYVNQNIGRIKRMFKWGVAEELIPPHVLQALQAVTGLARGRTEARESEGVKPVDEATVNATLEHMSRTAADMVRVQRLTGMRPGEVCDLRPCDIDRTAGVWTYRPSSHKMQHKGRDRVVYIGPKAQLILLPYLMRSEPHQYCFRPHRRPKFKKYAVAGYRTAIWNACERAFPPPAPLAKLPGETDQERIKRLTENQRKALNEWNNSVHWSPNQLRHSAATEIRAKFGLEAAQVTLGHADAGVTQIYAERDADLARQVAREVG